MNSFQRIVREAFPGSLRLGGWVVGVSCRRNGRVWIGSDSVGSTDQQRHFRYVCFWCLEKSSQERLHNSGSLVNDLPICWFDQEHGSYPFLKLKGLPWRKHSDLLRFFHDWSNSTAKKAPNKNMVHWHHPAIGRGSELYVFFTWNGVVKDFVQQSCLWFCTVNYQMGRQSWSKFIQPFSEFHDFGIDGPYMDGWMASLGVDEVSFEGRAVGQKRRPRNRWSRWPQEIHKASTYHRVHSCKLT